MEAPRTLHPTDQTLHAYGLGKLEDSSAESVNQHLESCPVCRCRVGEISPDSFLGKLRAAQGPGAPVMSATDPSQLGSSQEDRGSSAPTPLSSDTLPTGLATHPDYLIIRAVGEGGMGVVYLARNRIMDRHEILKVVSSHLMNRKGVADRFLAEIRNAARLQHPHIVTAYSAFRVAENLVFAMEYVDGLDLSRLVHEQGPLPVPVACNFAYQVALGLQYAHEQKMVHRDIKPSNLIVARQGKRTVVKILDFGLAKATREGPQAGSLTHEGQMLGTPDYIAPEQISNAQRADIRADIYSLGCTLYYLLTGRPPFPSENLCDILQAHHSMEATPLNLARPEVPVELAALVAKMMAKEPHRRFQEPREVADALVPFFMPSAAPSARRPQPQAELSQTGSAMTDDQPFASETPSPPTRPKDVVAPVATSAGSDVARTARSDSLFENLITLDEDEPNDAEVSEAMPTEWREVRAIWMTVGAVLILGLLAPVLLNYMALENGSSRGESTPKRRRVAAGFETPSLTRLRSLKREPGGHLPGLPPVEEHTSDTPWPDPMEPWPTPPEFAGAPNAREEGGAADRPADLLPAVVVLPATRVSPVVKDNPEQRLAELGLRPWAKLYVLEEESEVLKKVNETLSQLTELRRLCVKKARIEFAEGRTLLLDQSIALLELEIKEQNRILGRQSGALDNQQKDYFTTIRNVRDGLDRQKDQAMLELKLLRAQLASVKDKDRQELNDIPRRREVCLSLLRVMHDRIESMDARYDQLKTNPQVRDDLAAIGLKRYTRLKLGALPKRQQLAVQASALARYLGLPVEANPQVRSALDQKVSGTR